MSFKSLGKKNFKKHFFFSFLTNYNDNLYNNFLVFSLVYKKYYFSVWFKNSYIFICLGSSNKIDFKNQGSTCRSPDPPFLVQSENFDGQLILNLFAFTTYLVDKNSRWSVTLLSIFLGFLEDFFFQNFSISHFSYLLSPRPPRRL